MRKIANLCMALGTVLIFAALSLLIYNQCQDRDAGMAARERLLEVKERAEMGESELISPDDIGEMAHVKVDGDRYIGYLSVPTLGVELPIMSEWSYPKLRMAPCRYFGSVFTDDLVIAAHNYGRHFGNLKRLRPGDPVFFTDVNQIRYSYEVEQVTTLEPTDVELVIGGDYPLTLFTCTYGGAMRVVVQCRKLNGVTTIP